MGLVLGVEEQLAKIVHFCVYIQYVCVEVLYTFLMCVDGIEHI